VIPVNCYRVAKLYSMGDMETASAPIRLMMRLHLALCPQCKRYVVQMKLLGEAARRDSEKKLDPKDVEALITRLITRLTG